MGRKTYKQKRREEKAQRRQVGPQGPATTPDISPLIILGLAAFLAFLTLVAYSNSFAGEFIYDDTKWIEQMSVDRIEKPITSALKARRPAVDLTLTLNYLAAEKHPAPRAMTVPFLPDPWGYHLVNLIVHVCAGLALFGLIRRTIRVGPFGDRVKEAAHWIAFAGAVIWLLHPLQTQGVTYVIQRAESMMGLFYILTLYGLVRFATARRTAGQVVWLIATFAAAALGMGSKGVMVTAPIVALIYDRVFLSQSWAELIRKRALVHGVIVASLIVLGNAGVIRGVLSGRATHVTVGMGLANPEHPDHISQSEYLLTEAQVIPRYLKLSLLPTDLVLDYKWDKVDLSTMDTSRFVKDVLPPGLLVVALLIATAIALVFRPWLGFVGVWFFVILAPTSTIIPIRDPIYEHRMYLSLASIAVLFVAGVWWLAKFIRPESKSADLGLICAGTALVVAVALGVLTYQRNALYRDAAAMWRDVITKRPDNWRARNNFAKQLLDIETPQGPHVDEAIEQLTEAVRLNPPFLNGWYNLGNAYYRNKDYDHAIEAYKNALKLKPDYTVAQIMIGNAYTDQGTALQRARDLPGAIAQLELAAGAFRDAVPTARGDTTNARWLRARSLYNLGNTYTRIWQIDESRDDLLAKAREVYEEALTHNPEHPGAGIGIGVAYRHEKKWDQAIEAFEKALTNKVPPAEARVGLTNLALCYAERDNIDGALGAYERLSKIYPNDVSTWINFRKYAAQLNRTADVQRADEQLKRLQKKP